ncbi:probable helicase MAGATAMA 3 isoform X1 [Solanum pennellii]|uniref:Probable helicase MAGATAMA 3 isoform X1 n=1 Tax=Solanum pennellii TaxID=28526 RepID=A0ABM1VED7_SOLPN|nr:probable helicase MAGATAMA 3 isoform X1 [Solanum pennellii]XP_027774106.1 probable helicase MAGATAMA 3 isoform X1 [Solanum pennellii]
MAVDKNKLEEEALSLRFYKIVLSWDYLRLIKESDRKKGKWDDDNALVLKKAKNSYKDVQDYLATFEPLLFEEVKAQIIQGKKDDEEAYLCLGIVETLWMKAVTVGCSEIDGFHFPMISCSDAESIQQNDLLLLSNKEFGDGKRLPTAYAFALVEDRRPDKIRLRMHLSGEVKQLNTQEIEACSRLLSMRPLVTENAKLLHVLKICSLSTIAREYVALRSVSSLPFKDLILSAADSNRSTEDQAWKISRPLKEFLESNHNKSQLDAINAGLSRKTFVLIQGPPGTGKTQTILGILSAILHATPSRVHSNRVKLSSVKRGPELSMSDKYKHWAKASPWLGGTNPLDQEMPIDGDDGFFPTSGNDLKPEVVNSSRKYRVRVLVCAPSNSALDEIVLRILNTGIRDENDRAYSPKIVRIGLKAHHSVQAVSMDYLVEQRLSGMDSQIGDRQKQGGPGKDKDSIRASILDEAVIVFSTLSFSASPVFTKLNRGFDVVIIDEAAQAVEPSTLLPLSNGCKQVFLVGDPVQLPATVISPIAGKFGYCTSLFERLQRAGYPVQMLKTQYRMHPEIRNFPSREFYEEALEDGPDVEVQTKRSWHEYRCFGPFCFFDIHDGKESQPSGSGSWQNVDEVEFVLAMYHKLVSGYPELKSSSRLAIISPYRYQVKLLRQKFRETFGVESDKVVDINTVDGFQGREKDVAIFSCVRASKDKGIGFVADYRRMNVGITRARSSVLVVGSASTLRKDARWQNLVESAEKRNALHKVSKPYAEFFSQENLKLMKVEVAHDKHEAPPEDMDIDVPIAAETDHAPQEDWGYAGEEGGYDED